MTIKPDGSFYFQEDSDLSIEQCGNCAFLDLIKYDQDKKYKKAQESQFDWILKDSKGNINIIKNTDLVTIPEAEKIKNLLDSGDTELRSKARKEELFGSCLDIKSFYIDQDFYYGVGTIGHGMRSKIRNAVNVRKVEIYKDSEFMFDKLLLLMGVSFVKNGQLTVVPFPFKYLSEYILQK